MSLRPLNNHIDRAHFQVCFKIWLQSMTQAGNVFISSCSVGSRGTAPAVSLHQKFIITKSQNRSQKIRNSSKDIPQEKAVILQLELPYHTSPNPLHSLLFYVLCSQQLQMRLGINFIFVAAGKSGCNTNRRRGKSGTKSGENQQRYCNSVVQQCYILFQMGSQVGRKKF